MSESGLYEPGDVPGVDRPWRYGDEYFWGVGANRYAMRVTDPEMMNLQPIREFPTAFVDVEESGCES